MSPCRAISWRGAGIRPGQSAATEAPPSGPCGRATGGDQPSPRARTPRGRPHGGRFTARRCRRFGGPPGRLRRHPPLSAGYARRVRGHRAGAVGRQGPGRGSHLRPATVAGAIATVLVQDTVPAVSSTVRSTRPSRRPHAGGRRDQPPDLRRREAGSPRVRAVDAGPCRHRVRTVGQPPATRASPRSLTRRRPHARG